MVNPVRALIFLIFLAVLQQIEGNVIYPRVVGTSIGLPGIWVLAAVTVGGGLFGLLGVLLSVPVASVVYALIKRDVRRRLDGEGGGAPREVRIKWELSEKPDSSPACWTLTPSLTAGGAGGPGCR